MAVAAGTAAAFLALAILRDDFFLPCDRVLALAVVLIDALAFVVEAVGPAGCLQSCEQIALLVAHRATALGVLRLLLLCGTGLDLALAELAVLVLPVFGRRRRRASGRV